MPLMSELYIVPVHIKNGYWEATLLVAAGSEEGATESAKMNFTSLHKALGLRERTEFELGVAQKLKEYLGTES